jgi:hypothetical protein
MCKSLETLKSNIANNNRRLSKTTVKNIINANCFEKIELAYYYDGININKGEIIENPVEWFNDKYNSIDVSLYKVENNIAIIHLTIHSNLWYNLIIDLKKDYTKTENKKTIETNITQNTDTKTYIDTMESKLKEGETTAQELKDYYIFLRDNSEPVKIVILQKINNSPKHKNKRNKTKQEITEQCYDNMIENLVYYVKETLSYTIDFNDIKGCRLKAIENIINSATDDIIKQRSAQMKAEKEARTERVNDAIEKMKNPQTLEDFQLVFQYRKTPLTAEEQERYDYLYSLQQKEKREKEQQEKLEKAKQTITVSNDIYNISAETDTRDNSPLWVVRLNNRVEKNEFNNIRYQIMKPIDGYYSSFKGGFIFKYDPTSKLIGEQQEQITEQQPEETQINNNSDKLRKLADNMQESIDYKRRDRQTNTYRRATMAANAEEDAEAMERTQNTLRNIADAIDNNELIFINKIDSKTQIETLNSILNHANCEYYHKEKLSYNEWREKTITADIIKYAEIPSNTIYLKQLQSIINEIKDTEGFKLIANRLQKVINNTHIIDKNYDPKIDITDYTEEIDKIYKNTDILKGLYFETAVEERRRLLRMGIETNENLRAYLREYLKYKTLKSTADPIQKKIKELEREYKLQQKGDINFTPAEVVEEMIQYAKIDNNSIVLEPSAGIGNIADKIKGITEHVDVCEQMYSFCELLKLKNHNVVSNDFLTYQKYNYYDAIIMNPPFSNNQDITHLKHAYNLLKPNGTLVCITSPHWTFASDKTSKEFKEWIEEKDYFTKELPSGTFEMTGVRSQIVVIEKKEETLEEAI